jgi:nucleoside-diphosphate-sugar epimerase
VRSRADVEGLLAERPSRVYLLAAQASRALSFSEPDYTEETNVTGARRVA